ncbi:hypothetical protein KDM41_08145 [bacterium]|nr:hypothetical protein [bacterium]
MPALPRIRNWSLLLGIGLVLGAVAGADVRAERTTLGRPGYLVIGGVRDTTETYAFRTEPGPGPGRRSLVWPEGTLTLPDSLVLEPYGESDVGLACRPALAGVGSSGQLVLRDGAFQVSEPLVISDGVFELHVARGTLEIRGDRIRYRRPDAEARRNKAQILFLAGLLLLIVVLMRRARQVARSR